MAYLDDAERSEAPSLVKTAGCVMSFRGRASARCFARQAPVFAGVAALAGLAWLTGAVPASVAFAVAAMATVALAALTVRRLHDVGRRGWTVGAQALLLGAMVGTGVAIHGQTVGLLLGEGLLGALALGFAATAALTWRRVRREGEPCENRYGPARP